MPDSPEIGRTPDPGGPRSFTDVASLFQPIVPPPGTPVRPSGAPPLEPQLPPPLQAANPPPPAPPVASPAAPPPPSAPKPALRSQPEPDLPEETLASAFAPQPNWEPPSRRNWNWLLLLPVGALAAWIAWNVDPEAIRIYFNQHIWSRQPQLAATAPPQPPAQPQPQPEAQREPLKPGPPLSPVVPDSTPARDEPPVAGVPLGPVTLAPASPQAGAPSPATPSAPPEPIPAAEAPAPAQPAPAEAAPEPPAPAASAPAPAAAMSAPQPAFGQVAIRYRRGSAGAEAEAARLTARLQPRAERVETRPAPGGYAVPTVLFFRPDDRPAALALAQSLPTGVASWTVRQGSGRQRAGYLEVWLP